MSLANEGAFDEAQNAIAELAGRLESARADEPSEDDYLADVFVIEQYLAVVHAYCRCWEQILDGAFSASWIALQDALDALRQVKRFSDLDISFFEDQLLELESAYPYKLFFSIGAVATHFECSICGENLDSLDCPHRRGELYGGRQAIGIARNLAAMDHVSIVDNPRDKRCVVCYEDDAPQFRLVRTIAEGISLGRMSILGFRRLQWGRKVRPRAEFEDVGRNDRCPCGSGQKFKRCCIDNPSIETDHVDIVGGHVEVGGL